MNTIFKNVVIACIVGTSLFSTACSSESDQPESPYQPLELTRGEQEIVEYSNTLGYKMLQASYNQDENTIESPLSMSVALGMLANGADGNTLLELKNVLDIQSVEELNACIGKVLDNLSRADKNVSLSIANSLWFDKGFKHNSEYEQQVSSCFKTDLFTMDLSSDKTMKKINTWCSDKTEGMIKNFLTMPLRNVDMALYNAMYFYGGWSEKFDRNKTTRQPFANTDGSVVQVDMMKKSKGLRNYKADDYAQTIEVPYGNGNFYLELELPVEGKTITDVLQARIDGMNPEKQDPSEIRLELPRFSVQYKFHVNTMLQAMGYTHIFNDANYSKISDIQPRLGLISQASVIEVDEEGSKASTVTGSGGVTSPGLPVVNLRFDRPFIYSIKERTNGVTLFCGVINKF